MDHQIFNLEVDELIEEFEHNIIYDCHSYNSKFRRSDARKKLVKRGREVLKPIIEHLRNKTPFGELQIAWGDLLNLIEIEIDPNKSGPQDLRDTEGWILWAEKFAE